MYVYIYLDDWTHCSVVRSPLLCTDTLASGVCIFKALFISIGKCLYEPQIPFLSTLKNKSVSNNGAKSFNVYFLSDSANIHLYKKKKNQVII